VAIKAKGLQRAKSNRGVVIQKTTRIVCLVTRTHPKGKGKIIERTLT